MKLHDILFKQAKEKPSIVEKQLQEWTEPRCQNCIYYKTPKCTFNAIYNDKPCSDGILAVKFGTDVIIRQGKTELIIPARFLSAKNTKTKLMQNLDLEDTIDETIIAIKKLLLKKPKPKQKEVEPEDPEIRHDAEQLLKDPDLLNKFIEHSNKWVIMDETTRKIELLTCVSAYGEFPLNLSLQQVWSAGKTHTITQVASYFENKDTWFLGYQSPKALIHQTGTYNEEKDAFIINLENKIIIFLDEPEYHTLMMLKPLLSHDRYEIEYKFVGENLQTITAILRGFPACVFCSVKSKYTEEFTSRWYTASPEVSQQKYREAISLMGKQESHPEKYKKDKDFQTWKKAFNILKTGGRWKAVIPYAEKLAEHFNPHKPADMRFFKLFIGLIKASTVLHAHQREKNQDDRLIATMEDYEIAHDIFKQIEEPTRYGVGTNVLVFYKNVILQTIETDIEYATYEQLAQKHYELTGTSLSTQHIKKHYLKPLERNGLIDTQQAPKDKRRKVVYVKGDRTPQPSLMDHEGFIK
jgi:hypothetical protein